MSETEEESDYEEEEVEEEEDEERPSSPDDPYLRGYRDGFLNASSRFNSDEDADSDDEDLDQYRQHSDFWKGFRAAIRGSYQIIVADAADAVSVNFSGRCKFLQI